MIETGLAASSRGEHVTRPKRIDSRDDTVIHAAIGIIGAGPAGLATAVHLGQLGVERVVLVDRQEFPRDKTCGSAVSPKGCSVLAELGVNDAVVRQSYPVKGLRLVTPRGHDVCVSSPKDVALICNRRILDDLLLHRAEQGGAKFLANFEASYLLQRGDRVVGFRSTDGREVRSDYTVIANGAHSRLSCDRGPRHLLQAIMGWWEGVAFRPHHVEMIFDELVSPYYGWLFPEGPELVNIGICYGDPQLSRNARQLFQSFLAKHFGDRLKPARQVGVWKGHPISFQARIARLTSAGRIVVGEAGRMTHPATAEGIYQGMRSGMLAADALHQILSNKAEPRSALRDYERACRRAFSGSFRAAGIWRQLVDCGALDIVVGASNHPMSRRVLARYMAQM
jgi:geranylgeranyl reductase family protein